MATFNAVPVTSTFYDSARYWTVGVFDKYGDSRVADYPLMQTPWPIIGMTCCYLWFVKYYGPMMMRDRKPYEILPIIRVYNLAMTVWNAFGFVVGCELLNYGLDTFGCKLIDQNQRDPKTMLQLYYAWMFLVSRLVEFADTVFFVLRKKDRQISAFHVFHHSSVPTMVWTFYKFVPGGNAGIFPFINAFIHTIMYSYYFLATYPGLAPYLFWKKYLTQMQIVQFLIIIGCCMQPLFIPGCTSSPVLSYSMIFLACVFICLFVDFYLKSYRKQATANLQKKKQHSSSIESHQPESEHLTKNGKLGHMSLTNQLTAPRDKSNLCFAFQSSDEARRRRLVNKKGDDNDVNSNNVTTTDAMLVKAK